MAAHAFVDETKAGRLTIVATVAAPQDAARCRRQLDQLRMKGQRRIHFTKESDARRRKILDAIGRLPVEVDVYEAPVKRGPKRARPEILRLLASHVIAQQVQRLVIEQDDSLIVADRRTLYEAFRGYDIQYVHCRPSAEPMLWISDAVAWCWQKGGLWRSRVEPWVRDVHQV